MLSSNGKFEILENSTDDDSYMYSDTSYHYMIVSVQTGDCLENFSGRWDEDAHGASKSGVESLTFTDASDKVIIHNFDGTTKEFNLPIDVKIIDKGRAIALTWPDGTVEKRLRSHAGFTSKYGAPFLARELKKEYKGSHPEPTDPDLLPKEGDRLMFEMNFCSVYERDLPNGKIQTITINKEENIKESKKISKKKSSKKK